MCVRKLLFTVAVFATAGIFIPRDLEIVRHKPTVSILQDVANALIATEFVEIRNYFEFFTMNSCIEFFLIKWMQMQGSLLFLSFLFPICTAVLLNY